MKIIIAAGATIVAALIAILVLTLITTLFGCFLEIACDLYYTLVDYGILKPRAENTPLREAKDNCERRNGCCEKCQYHTKTGCGLTGPPKDWPEEMLKGKRILPYRRWI